MTLRRKFTSSRYYFNNWVAVTHLPIYLRFVAMCKTESSLLVTIIAFSLIVQLLFTGVATGYVIRVGSAVRPYSYDRLASWPLGRSYYAAPSKRRLVVRVPFAQNPDNEQLSRIYKSMFTHSKQKKIGEYSLRSFLEDA
uniref:Transmembrane protein n=1 Tax=Steinernema glaseri TaxID=37863 RepID=A0A1I7ZF64_9BILA